MERGRGVAAFSWTLVPCERRKVSLDQTLLSLLVHTPTSTPSRTHQLFHHVNMSHHFLFIGRPRTSSWQCPLLPSASQAA